MAEDQDKKIKELEVSLARELDQQVNLSAPTDSRIGGAVDLNPSLNLTPKASSSDSKIAEPEITVAPNEIPTPDFETKQPAGDEDEVSLEDLDSLLKQEMPELENELNSLRDAGKDLEGKEVNLGEFDVNEMTDATPVADELPERLSLLRRGQLKLKTYVAQTYNYFYHLPIRTYKYTIAFGKNQGRQTLLRLIERIKYAISSTISYLKNLTMSQKFIFVALLGILGVIAFLLFSQISISSISTDPYLESFSEHTKAVEYSEKQFVPLSEEGQYPEHVVLLDKVVVNIKASESSSPNPMVAMRMYFEVTSQEAAIEMKDREKEMRDLAQRVLETYTYDQIITASGKKAFKEGLRKEMSAILNNGLVKNVFIDEILLKP